MQNSELLWNPLSGITDALSDLFDGLINRMLSVFITPLSFFLYSLQMGFFYVLDCVQGIFRSMAGLDAYYIEGEKQSGDIVMSMLMNQTIVNIFIAVLVVSIMLLFVTTFVAIIRVEFTEKGAGNAKGPIIGRAVKSIAYFAVVPITCLFGIWIANVFLRSFDRATSGDSYSLSTTVFYAAAQNANRARLSEKVATKMMENTELLRALGLNEGIVGQEGAQETFARAVDSAFLSRLEVSEHLSTKSMTIDAGAQDYFFAAMLMNLGPDVTFSVFDTTNIYLTFYFYELLMGFNYLIGYMGGFMAASLLLSSAIGLIQRIYELAILFVLSPAAVAFMPLDDGGKYKQWRGEFIKRVGMMYGPVIGLNLMFQVLAVLQHVTIFPDTPSNAIFNGLIQLIFMIVGLLSIKEFSQIVSGLVGSSDAMQVGEGKKQDTVKMAQRAGQGTIGAVKTGRAVGSASVSSLAGLNNQRKARKMQKEAVALAASDPTKAREKAQEAKALFDKGKAQREAGLGGQFNKMMQGDAGKTDIGKAFGTFAAAAGPVASYFNRGSIAKRKEEGRGGILGEIKMFGNKGDKRTVRDRLKASDDGTLADGSELNKMTDTVDGQRFRNAGRHVWNAVKHVDNARRRASAAYNSYDTVDEATRKNKDIKTIKDAKESAANTAAGDTEYRNVQAEMAFARQQGYDVSNLKGDPADAAKEWAAQKKALGLGEDFEKAVKEQGNVNGVVAIDSGATIQMKDAVINIENSSAQTAESTKTTSDNLGSVITGGGEGGEGGTGTPETTGDSSGTGAALKVNVAGGKVESEIKDEVKVKQVEGSKVGISGDVKLSEGSFEPLNSALEKIARSMDSQASAMSGLSDIVNKIATDVNGIFTAKPK